MCDEDYWRKEAESWQDKYQHKCAQLFGERELVEIWEKQLIEAREDAQDTIDGLKAIIDIRVDERDEARKEAEKYGRKYRVAMADYIWQVERTKHIAEDVNEARRIARVLLKLVRSGYLFPDSLVIDIMKVAEAKRELPWL